MYYPSVCYTSIFEPLIQIRLINPVINNKYTIGPRCENKYLLAESLLRGDNMTVLSSCHQVTWHHHHATSFKTQSIWMLVPSAMEFSAIPQMFLGRRVVSSKRSFGCVTSSWSYVDRYVVTLEVWSMIFGSLNSQFKPFKEKKKRPSFKNSI